jgi:hypothetical protein
MLLQFDLPPACDLPEGIIPIFHGNQPVTRMNHGALLQGNASVEQ